VDKQLKELGIDNPVLRAFLAQNIVPSHSPSHSHIKSTSALSYKADENAPQFKYRINLPAIANAISHLSLWSFSNQKFDGPTLFLRGELSLYISDKHFDSIQQQFPNSTIETIKGAGHWIHAEKPNELIQAIHRFLQHNKL